MCLDLNFVDGSLVAYIQASDDMVKNVWVIVAGTIISINPLLTFAEKLCKLSYSVMMFSITYGLSGDTLTVLMES